MKKSDLVQYSKLISETEQLRRCVLRCEKVSDGRPPSERLARAKYEYAESLCSVQDRMAVIERAVASLPNTEERQVLRLRYILGRSWEDIGDELHYSLRQVYRLHGRALLSIADK